MRSQLLGNIRMLRRAFEDHVLEQMRHACLTVILSGRANEIGYVYSYGLLALIGEHKNTEAVSQPVLVYAFNGGHQLNTFRQGRNGGLSEGGKRRGQEGDEQRECEPRAGGMLT